MTSLLFKVHRLNPAGLEAADKIASEFDRLLLELESLCADSREFSVAKTKLEEACFFAKKSLAIQVRFQERDKP